MIFISFISKIRSAVILPVLLSTASLQAATYNVNTTADGTSSSGTVNLRGAILAANSAGGSHTVNVPAGTYNLTLGEITFGTTAQNITISGTGNVTINMSTGANQDRIFNINPNVISGVTTSVSGITFTNGYLKSDGYGGGAILSGGPGCALNLTNCSFSNNTVDPTISVVYGGGGAVALIYGGTLTVTNCQFSGNSISFPTSIAANYRTGGAIYAYSYGSGSLYPDMSINISGSTFTGNSVSNSGQGGAIFVQTDANGTASVPAYSVSITKNNFVNNSATGTSGLGGAVSVLNYLSGSATSVVQYNRFYGNTSGGGNASALYMDNNSGSINATNNWWGCNGGPTACADKAYRNTTATNGGTLTSTPYMQLKAAASATSICAGATSAVTADFSQNSAATTITAANLSAFTGVPISFQAALGTVSPTSTTLNSSAAATTTYTAGSTAGSGTVNAIVDNVPASDATARATVTINPSTGIGTAPPATTTVCAGNTATISVTASGGGTPTYQWRRGTTNLSNGATGTGSTLSGVTSPTLTITNAGASDAAANYNVVITGCGSVTSSNAALVISTPGTWLGGTSVAWSNTANWSCGVLPTSATNVVIPAGTTFSPQVNITNAAVNDITIANGASLSFSGSANVLSVSGAITNTGTLNPANGRISFDGTNQSIPALSYDGLTIAGGGTKTAAGAITVNTSLVLGNGYLALGANNLTIGNAGAISGATTTGFVLINGTGHLIQQNIGATGRSGAILFPVGISSGSYTPVTLTNTGTSDAFSVDMLNAVYAAYDAAGNPTSPAQTMNAVAKTWRVTEGTPGGTTATLAFQWSPADELPGFTRSSCFASHYYSGGWHRGAVSAASGSNPYTQTLTGVTTFSPFGVGSGASPLPLQLLSFGGEARAAFNELHWTIAAQQDHLRFEVQRSNDGAGFAAIGIIDGEGPDYVFNDVEPAAMQYYRLAMMDGSGERSYSKIVSLRRAAAASGLEVRPNPFRDRIFIQLKKADTGLVRMELRNALGQLILQRDEAISPANPATTISGLEQLPAGIYFLILNYGQNVEQVRLVKE